MVGDLDGAEGCYRSAIALDPDSAVLHYNLALLLFQTGDVTGAEAEFRRVLEIAPGDFAANAGFLCLCDFSRVLSRDDILKQHLQWASRFSDPLTRQAPFHPIDMTPDRRLRVGYVSADFRRHAVGRFIEPVFRLHDASRFDLYCYSNTQAEDDMTRHLRTFVPRWRNIHGMDDAGAAEMIRADKIDILVDLSGHSAGNRLLVFARRPAPVQMTWLGYLNTTGMGAMDYRITDSIADPPGADCWYREKLLRLSRPQWCYVPEAGPVTAPSRPVISRVNHGSAAPITLACMTRFMKISDATLDLWLKILQAVPGARLRIIDAPRHARTNTMMQFFEEAGVGDRVAMFPTLHGDSYWDMLDEVDVALDPFPYTGATTTFDCLWMGVPVVTLAGQCGAARSASSILSALGLADFIASSPEQYVAIAVAFANDPRRLAGLRTSLRRRMKSSVLCDGEALVRELEATFCIVWGDYCGNEQSLVRVRPR